MSESRAGDGEGRVWLQVVGEATPAGAVRAALHARGLHVDGSAALVGHGPGLVLFERSSAELCERVQKVSREGIERVLALAVSRAALAGGVAWQLRRAGASDVFAWDQAPDAADAVVARFARWTKVDELVRSPLVRDNLVGTGRAWMSLLRDVVEAAVFTDSPLLVLGESGTGKELIARLVHSLDRRRHKNALVVLDCTTIVPELSGSEFFGHERGAFTGAAAARDGAFALADAGTLFLDEVGELSLPLQAQLLRVIQERTYKRVGGNAWMSTDFRLVCATNRDLPGEVERGHFRRDLYHRIASWICRVPPLRQRPEDILPLVHHFLGQLRPGETIGIDEAVREYLLRRSYPGNVRDLRQVVHRICHRHVGGGPITVGDVPFDELPELEEALDWRQHGFEDAIRRALACGVQLKQIGRIAHDTAVRMALDAAEGNLQQAARQLGVTDRALQLWRRAGEQSAAADGS